MRYLKQRAVGSNIDYTYVTSIVPGAHVIIITRYCEDSIGVVLEEDEGRPFGYKKVTEMTVKTLLI